MSDGEYIVQAKNPDDSWEDIEVGGRSEEKAIQTMFNEALSDPEVELRVVRVVQHIVP